MKKHDRSLKRTRPKVVIVCDKKAKREVLAKQNLTKVPVRTTSRKACMRFPLVRRNMKIAKVVRMANSSVAHDVALEVVTSTTASLSNAASIYGQGVIDVLRSPKRYVYSRAKDIKGVNVWNVAIDGKEPAIMQTDFSGDELSQMRDGVEADVGVVKESVSQLLAGTSCDVIAINTHPGHHAGPSRVAGFCVINYVALAASFIKTARPQWKVGVLDIDVHPGDGTKQFFDRQRRLIDKYVSIHSAAQFLNICAEFGKHGVALRLDNSRKVAAHRLISKVDEVLTSWNRAGLNVVIVSLGFDTLRNDRTAQCGFQMLPANFQELGRVFAKRREQMLFVQEGGYNLDETADAFECLVTGFRDARSSSG
eukprot:TRINITY_DN37687_c0_g1_i1.p1 TRINITY_DN37687_c0_g1~~TRINITY_DN37687_c0_g1_i1.p1  ORF type:complete len:381 (+),score=38.40 TRINITY_DN37687_c0_g1_i1:48-1145(+)